MEPLMCLDGDGIMGALLLGPTDDGPRTSPTPEEQAVLLGDELEPLEAQEATTYPSEHPGAPKTWRTSQAVWCSMPAHPLSHCVQLQW